MGQSHASILPLLSVSLFMNADCACVGLVHCLKNVELCSEPIHEIKNFGKHRLLISKAHCIRRSISSKQNATKATLFLTCLGYPNPLHATVQQVPIFSHLCFQHLVDYGINMFYDEMMTFKPWLRSY